MMTTAQLDPSLDVSRRLADLRAWQAEWQRIDRQLEEQVSHLDDNNFLQLQQSVQISNVRRRMAMTDASKNRSPFQRACSNIWAFVRFATCLPASSPAERVRNVCSGSTPSSFS